MNRYQQLGVEPVINASGRMTALGGSALSADTVAAMAEAGEIYVDISALQDAVGRELAGLLGAEAAMVTTGAAAGIALMVAACIAGDDLTRIEALPDPGDTPNEVVLQAGHLVNFGAPVRQMIALGGGNARLIGTVNGVRSEHLRGALGSHAAAFLYVKSHHCVQKGMLPLANCIDICHDRGVPVLVDAAAEEDVAAYTGSGADLVTFSGGKAIGGPASGIIAGRADLIAACRAQNRGIGRPMKVGKETILGLYAATHAYLNRDLPAERERQRQIVDYLLAAFADLPGARPHRLSDEAGRGIERAGLELMPDAAGTLVTTLQAGSPPIYPRTHLMNLGIVAFDPRPITMADAEVIARRVQAALNSPHPAPSEPPSPNPGRGSCPPLPE